MRRALTLSFADAENSISEFVGRGISIVRAVAVPASSVVAVATISGVGPLIWIIVTNAVVRAYDGVKSGGGVK